MQDRRKQALPDKQKIYVAIISLTFIARYLTVDNCSLWSCHNFPTGIKA